MAGVASAADTGVCTLRKAIANADSNSTIRFEPSLSGQTITPGGVELLIDKNLTIDGSDLPGGIDVSRSNTSRVVQIASQKSVVIKCLKNGGSASLNFANNIVAGNSVNVGPDRYNNATFTPSGANLIGKNDTVAAQFPAGPLAGTSTSPLNPKLAPPASCGGPNRTMPPLPGSPVIEKAVLPANTPATDQRGNPRPAGPLPDIGAVEAGPFPLGSLAGTGNDGIPDVLEGPSDPYPQFTVGVNDSALDTGYIISFQILFPSGHRFARMKRL